MGERREPRTGQVRIVGAEPVGEPDPFADEATGGEPASGEIGDDTVLPHWTEAPTGQVPAVLSGGEEDDDPWRSLPTPTWREEHTDWAAQEEAFDPSMLAAVDELPEDGDERQPWSFELDAVADKTGVPHGAHAARQSDEELFRELTEPGPYEDDPWGVETVPAEPASGRSGPVGRWGPGSRADRVEDTGEVEEVGGLLDGSDVGSEEAGAEDAGPAVGTSTAGAHAGVPGDAGPATGGALAGLGSWEPEANGGGLTGPTRRGGRQQGGRNVPVAVASGLVLGGLALVCFAFGTVTSMVVATAVVGLAAVEGYAAFRKAGYHPATLLGLVAVVGVMVGVYNRGEAAEPLVVVLLVAFTLLWHLTRVDKGADPVRSTLSTLFVYCWVGVFGSYAALLLSPTVFSDRHGIAYLLGAVITVVAYDVAALGVGSWVGHRPLSAISPNKTWEGLIGGTVVAIVVAVMVVHLIHPWTIGKAAALGVIVAVLAPIGDLAESLVKRHVGVKDMGRVLPGHGGLLDRIDGLLFVLPATYYLVRAFHLG